jgi:DNA invertase Pin-like site-specific DNA recombinase
MQTESQKPVDIYVRVSRVGGREHLTSPQDQEREARTFAQSRGLTVGEVFADLDESGGKLERPALQKALARVEAGQSAGIVVAYLSRASRDTSQGLGLLDRITRAGGAVYAPNLPADYTTADGRMLTTIQLAIDTGYRQKKAEEFESAKRGAIEAGIPVHSRPPVGYRARADRRLEPDPVTAPVIRELFERRATGEGPAALGDFLKSHGVKTSQGSAEWSKPAVQCVIRSRVYLGELSYGKDRRYVNPNAHEAIVDLATWTAAQHPNGRRLQAPRGNGSYLLTGLLRCQACGYVMQATTTSRGKRIYRCVRRHAGGICPAPARIYADRIEPLAERAFWAVTEDLSAKSYAKAPDELAALEDALARAERRYAEIDTEEAQDAYGADWLPRLRERREARDAAAEALGRAQATRRTDTPSSKTMRGVWNDLSAVDKRELIATRLDLLALGRDGLAVFPSGTGPDGLSRRGFKREPGLHPIDVPVGARMLPLQDPRESGSERGV